MTIKNTGKILRSLYYKDEYLGNMKLKVDCIPCVQRQIIKACRFSNLSEENIEKVLREVMLSLLNINWHKTPPEIAHVAHSVVRRYVGGDPYAQIKRESNDLAMKIYLQVREIVESSDDPLRTAIRVAIAGNIMDFGAMIEFDLEKTIDDVLHREFAYDDYLLLLDNLRKSKNVLYFFDNAGEIVFDKLLIEKIIEMFDVKITGVIKAGPIINDATYGDLRYVGLDKLVSNIKYLSNGEKGYERNSMEVGNWIRNHDVVISKGQGNYEGLSDWHNIFYLLMVKCPVIAGDLNARVGDIVFLYK